MTMSERDAKRSAPVRAEEPTDNRCTVCRYDYPTGGMQAGPVWGVFGPGYKVCRRCVEAGRDERRRTEREIRQQQAALPPVQEPPTPDPLTCPHCDHMTDTECLQAQRVRELEAKLARASSPSQGVRLDDYLARQIDFSRRTFGEGRRTLGVTAHIGKELDEIRANPDDLSEWIDVMILAMDGYWRHGGTPDTLMRDLQAKQDKNLARKWPKPTSEDVPVEHDRSEDALSAALEGAATPAPQPKPQCPSCSGDILHPADELCRWCDHPLKGADTKGGQQ